MPRKTIQQLSSEQRRAALAAVILLACAGLWTLLPFFPAFGWAIVFAVSLWPYYAKLGERWPQHRGILLPGLAVFLTLLLFVAPLTMIATALAQDSAALIAWEHQAALQGVPAPAMLQNLPFSEQLTGWWQANLARPGALSHLPIFAQQGSTFDLGGRFLGAVLHRVLLVVFMLLILFFLLRGGEDIAQGLRRGSARAFGPAGETVGEQIVRAIRGTVNGLVVVGLGEGVLMGAAYYIAGVPHPAVLGLLTGLLSAIPLGAVIAYAIAAGLLVLQGAIGEAVGIAVFGSVVVFVADHFIRPVLIGGTTRLPFLLVLLGIIGGIEAWGLVGIVLGPALMAALLLLWREWIGTQPGPLNPPDTEAAETGD
ncbi:MAG: AI-2E family transporter [Candidatus Andeanibacterium colombiense]|uniref:AI-2E family transporter n=1 Tax=Candidatus Andeanibacterium colombiense TaxID=3121345 RepID=A0AAJ5X440_9SPHN|nr:MAG: AI-2E family transporter [Sphingomonadaceae bacterium]